MNKEKQPFGTAKTPAGKRYHCPLYLTVGEMAALATFLYGTDYIELNEAETTGQETVDFHEMAKRISSYLFAKAKRLEGKAGL